ncbi:MAG: hypothetical protein [Podoviridae sp. cty5g4]|nr:MAG: hypothetical protein [Podoviridae sp. cty5g4]
MRILKLEITVCKFACFAGGLVVGLLGAMYLGFHFGNYLYNKMEGRR